MHKTVLWASIALAFVAVGLSVAWLCYSPDFEPALATVASMFSLLLIGVDRWVKTREMRRAMLRVLMHEVFKNLQVADEVRQKISSAQNEGKLAVLPRFYLSGTEAAVASGVFTEAGDTELWNKLHRWISHAHQLNLRFQITENSTFINGADPRTLWAQPRHLERFEKSVESLTDLSRVLTSRYESESGITAETVLFPE